MVGNTQVTQCVYCAVFDAVFNQLYESRTLNKKGVILDVILKENKVLDRY